MPVRQELGALKPGLEGVADKGKPFNATDRLDGDLPRRRLLAAAQSKAGWLIALEHGGRGNNVQAYLFSSAGELREHWVLSGSPATLQAVLDQIPSDLTEQLPRQDSLRRSAGIMSNFALQLRPLRALPEPGC